MMSIFLNTHFLTFAQIVPAKGVKYNFKMITFCVTVRNITLELL